MSLTAPAACKFNKADNSSLAFELQRKAAQAVMDAPISEGEARTFAEKFIAALERCEAADIAALVDGKTLSLVVAEQLEVPAAERLGASKGFGDSLPGALYRIYCAPNAEAAEKPRYRLSRLIPTPNGFRPVIRMWTSEHFDFHMLTLGKRAGEVMYVDGSSVSAGASLTVMLAEAGQAAVDSVKDAKPLNAYAQRMQEAAARGAWQEAMQAVDALPESIRQTRAVRLAKIQIAAEISEEALQAATDEFLAAYPQSLAGDMIALGSTFAAGDYDKALASLDRMVAQVGTDPYLRFMQASSLLNRAGPGDVEQAVAWLDEGLAAEPTLEDLHTFRLEAALAQRDFDKAVAVLATLEADFDTVYAEHEMRENDFWDGFLASKAGARWRRAQAVGVGDDGRRR